MAEQGDKPLQVVPAPTTDPRETHFEWFRKHRGGMSFEDIARLEFPALSGASLRKQAKAIERSVKEVQAFRNFATAQEVETAQQQIMVELSDAERKNLLKMMAATQYVEKNGELVEEPDWDVRMMAHKLLNEKYAIMAKANKGSAPLVVAVSQQNTAGGSKQSVAEVPSTQVSSFEELMRGIRQKREQASRNLSVDDGKLLGDAGGVIEGV